MDQNPVEALTKRPVRIRVALIAASVAVIAGLGGGTYAVAQAFNQSEPPAAETASPTPTFEPNIDPVAAVTITGQTDLTVTLSAAASTDADGEIASYDWDLGDGNVGTGVEVSHTYAAGGTYTVLVTVTDDFGRSSVAEVQVTVTAPPPPSPPPPPAEPTYGNYPPGYPPPSIPGTTSPDTSACASGSASTVNGVPVCD